MAKEDPPKRPPSYSTAYVAARLGVSVPTVQRWVDAGQLKAWKTLGGHRRIDARSAERLFEAQPVAEELAPGAASLVIVEDNPDDRDVLAALCSEALPGARLTLAENGFLGLVAIGRESPDAVITDLVMPNMDGIEMLNQLARDPAARPRVLIATSSVPPGNGRNGALPPGVVFVRKPIDPGAFIELLRARLAPPGRGI